MATRPTIVAAAALVLAASGSALAQEPPAFSSPVIETQASSPADAGFLTSVSVWTMASSAHPSAHSSAPRFDAVRYEPRYRPRPPASEVPVPREARGRSPATAHLQIHGGFLERDGGDGGGPTSFALGFRTGPSIGDRLQLGVGADWYHESESEREVVGEAVQGGRPVTTTNVLARANADLIPIQAHLQLGGGGRVPLGPYAGVAGGYQILVLSAADYQNGTDFNATYGGWGWQAWGGLALRLSSNARLFAEVFANTGEVERDVHDPVSGLTYREGTNTDGVGMRFGLNFGI